LLRSSSCSDARAAEHHEEQLAKKSKIKLAVLTSIEEGTIDGGDFGLKEICTLSAGMGVTPYRLMLAYESKLKDVEKENDGKA
jgi:hypothetical protein